MSALISLIERLQGRLAQIEPVQAQVIAASVLVILLTLIGIIGYSTLEGLSLMDGLYMTFITLTTIGFSEIRPLSAVGRIFTMIIGTLGIVTLGFIVTRTTQLLVTRQRLRLRHITKMIERQKDHYILCGYGRIGARIARDLFVAGNPFVVIENAPHKIEVLQKTQYLYLEGNAEEETTLQQAGIEWAKGLITTLRQDSDNVFVTLMARELNPNLLILARSNTSANDRRLYRAGADKVISPYDIGADRMARVILQPHVDRFLENALNTTGIDLTLEEVMVEPGSLVAQKSLIESDFRNRFGAIVVGIVNAENGDITFNPSAQTIIQSGDILIVLGKPEMVARLRAGCKQPITS